MRRLSSDSPSQPPQPTPIIPDHTLLRRVGTGAYGEVWLARTSMGTFRAVKIVYRASFEHDQPYEREFAGIRNFEPISRMHRGHVDILQVGINQADGYFYYVMEVADDEETGQKISPANYRPKTLHSELQRRRRLPPGECLSVAIALTEALSHLHKNGLIHRDIKPANIIYLRGQPRLTDIGLVSRFDATVSIVGTDGFMPPEGRGSPVADVYSLGKVLYEMATGNDRHRFPELPTLTAGATDSVPDALTELNQIILRACETNPRARYQSAEEMRDDLRLLQSGESLVRLRRLERRLKQAKAVAAAAAVVALLGGGALLLQARHTAVVEGMARANHILAERHRDHLIAAYTEAGARELEEGANHHALRSFARALETAEGDPAREKIHYSRLNALIGQHPKLLGVLKHDGWVRYAEFSPDGRKIVTASDEGSARIWDGFTGAPLSPPLEHSGAVHRARFSPDGSLVLTASHDGTGALWEVESGKQRATLPHDGIVYQARFSPDGGKVLTASTDGTAQLWNIQGEAAAPPIVHGGEIYWTEFSPDGGLLVTAGTDGAARLWDAATAEPLEQVFRHDEPIYFARFSPDGRLLATAGGDGTVAVWKIESGDLAFPRIPLSGELIGANFSPCGRYLAVGDRSSKQLQIRSVSTGSLVREFEGNLSLDPSFSPDGAYIAYSYYGIELRVANIHTGRLLVSPLQNAWFDAASFSQDGYRIAVPSIRDGLVKVWDFAADGLVKAEIDTVDPIGSLAYSPDGSRLATAGMRAQVWDASTGTAVSPPLQTESHVLLAEFSPDSERLLTASGPFYMNFAGNAWDHTHEVAVWDARTAKMVYDPISPGNCINFAAFSPDGQKIVTADSDRAARVWDAETGTAAAPPVQHRARVWQARFDSDASRLLTASSRKAAIWETKTASPQLAPLEHEQLVDQVLFHPNKRWILTGSYHDQTLRAWVAATAKMVGELELPGMVTRFELTRDGDRLLTYGFGCATVVDLTAPGPDLGFKTSEPRCHNGVMTFATMDPGGRYLWTQCATWGKLRDLQTGAPLAAPIRRHEFPETQRGHRRGTAAPPAAFHPNRPELAMIADQTTVRILNWESDMGPPSDLRAIASILGAEPRAKNSPPEQGTIFQVWQDLREKHPPIFTSQPDAVWRWHCDQAQLLWEEGQADAALWHGNRLVELRPEHPKGHGWRSRIARSAGNWTEARENAGALVRLRGSVGDYQELALVFLAAGDLDSYRELSGQIQQRFSNARHFPTHLLAAWLAALAPGGVEEPAVLAASLEQRAEESERRGDPEVALTVAALYYRADQFKKAEPHLQRAVRISDGGGQRVGRYSLPRAWALLAMNQHQLTDDGQAEATLEQLSTWLHDHADHVTDSLRTPDLNSLELNYLFKEATDLLGD